MGECKTPIRSSKECGQRGELEKNMRFSTKSNLYGLVFFAHDRADNVQIPRFCIPVVTWDVIKIFEICTKVAEHFFQKKFILLFDQKSDLIDAQKFALLNG